MIAVAGQGVGPVSARQARELLALADAARRSVRVRRRPLWLPLVALGVAAVAVSPLYVPDSGTLVGGTRQVAPAARASVEMVTTAPVAIAWWVVALSVAYGVTLGGFRHRASASGWVARPWVWLVSGVVACVSPLALPPAGRALIRISADVDGVIGAIAPGLAGFWVLAAGLLVVASVERRGEFAVAVIVVSAVTVGASLYDVTNPVRWPLLTGLGAAGDVTTIGVALMTAGIFVWLIERRSGSMADRVGLGLDETVHQRTRLAIVATLTEVSKVDFASLRDGLGLTDGNLARHLQVLEEAGFVGLTKESHGARVRTWVEMTRAGRDAYDEEIRQLRALVTRADERSAAIRPGESARTPRLGTSLA